ncbi:MAG: hypothetical protein K9M99_00145 [Candidatus Cloacimonetes bacterium]|nr:hypothetical protein [Candidatus Cloacimonadota bacterium]
MNDNRKKKIKAAIAAVTYYLQEEEARQTKKTSFWLRSGREMTMNNRYLVQMRNFRR